jgi:uncharacterized protein HemX
MKKLMLVALTVVCISGISFSQQDSTSMNKNKTSKEQKNKSSQTMDNNNKSSKRKMNKQKTDSVNNNMDSTTRMETR